MVSVYLFLKAKPPLYDQWFSHYVIFSKTVILWGGLTLVRTYERQP